MLFPSVGSALIRRRPRPEKDNSNRFTVETSTDLLKVLNVRGEKVSKRKLLLGASGQDLFGPRTEWPTWENGGRSLKVEERALVGGKGRV